MWPNISSSFANLSLLTLEKDFDGSVWQSDNKILREKNVIEVLKNETINNGNFTDRLAVRSVHP